LRWFSCAVVSCTEHLFTCFANTRGVTMSILHASHNLLCSWYQKWLLQVPSMLEPNSELSGILKTYLWQSRDNQHPACKLMTCSAFASLYQKGLQQVLSMLEPNSWALQHVLIDSSQASLADLSSERLDDFVNTH